ncbi:serine/threonine-protein kinase [Rhodohalobacter sulfatireducens]|uniref:Serine/threonine-protein kinase n=1 Tax=Rhodohalobacter sulfatireducens TaxID=2911366 RepID=A0ABS9KFN4_9BACT|nr:serine/threonine-protein kinase [Rhodohalobacter sulfatireducens]MCG2589676.1 serine/threonine-protein kinase [Rhodohalobacter sulfatireducens]
MNPDQWHRVQSLFKELVDLDQDTRIERLESVKTEDPLLFEELMSLLAADSDDTSLIDGFAIDQLDISQLIDHEGEQIGPFLIAKTIGSGGMGSVYLAHRVEGGFDQTVALKLIKIGMGSEQAIRRFESERKILARLQHPHIARLVDGGMTGKDHPWFAMEYVEGENLLTYCDRLNLSIEKRLELFLDVTEAVQYAHKNLVVHRDLKPGNIMVTGDDSKPLVKLLDFGISQIMDESEADQAGIKAMTRAYASPEQLNGESTSTATDIYSLGVILHQLISGSHPKEEFRSRNSHPKPFDKELAAICEKAMQNDSSGRFQNASDFGEEIDAWLKNRPVSSYSVKPMYRFNKWMKRNRAASLIGIFAFIALAAVVLLYTNELQKETERAQQEAETSEQIAGFLQGLFELTDPALSRGDTLTAFTMLDRGAEQIEEDLQNDPEILARMYDVLAEAYLNLWNTEKAEEIYKKSLAIKQDIYENDHNEIANSFHNIGHIYVQDGHFEQGDSLLTAALQIRRSTLDPNDPAIGLTLQRLGFLKLRTGQIDQAEELYTEALRIFETGTDNQSVMEAASLVNSLGMIHENRGEYEKAVSNYREAVETLRAIEGDDHPRVINYLSNLGYSLNLLGKSEEAEPYIAEAIEVAKQVRGERHPHTALAMNEYANFYFSQGEYENAEIMFREILDIYIETFGEEHPAIPVIYNNLGNTRNNLGDFEAALEYHQYALDRRIELYGDIHSETAQSFANLATTFSDMERYEEALEYYNKALDIEVQVYGELHPETAYSYEAIGNVYKYMGQMNEAEQNYLKGYEILLEVLGEEHIETENARERLVELYEETGQDEKRDAFLGN